jgi:hypothetical protein
MIAETAALVGSLKTLYDLASGLQAMKTDTEIKMATADLLNAVITTRQQVFETQKAEDVLLAKNRELEAEIQRLTAWGDEKQRYEMKRYWPGSVAWTLKPSMAGGQPIHHLCAQCFQAGKPGYLQATTERHLRDYIYRCTSCSASMPIGHEESGEQG